ncbi:MAG TPA: ribonuclease III [Rectinemataceae bacterium]
MKKSSGFRYQTRRRTSSKPFGTRTSSSRPRSNKAVALEGGDRAKRISILQSFLARNGLCFRDIDLLDSALTHRSCALDHTDYPQLGHNERLEFLGDAVLGLAAAHLLFSASSEDTEGDMSRMKSQAVSEANLARIAKAMGVPEALRLGRGEELSGGRGKKAILADALEAIIGAFFLDSGWEEAEKLVKRLLSPTMPSGSSRAAKDSKTLIQEYAQKHCRSLPRYTLVKSEGPEHDRLFWVIASLGETIAGPCVGKTKKEAEQVAAKALMDALTASYPEENRLISLDPSPIP